MAGNARSSPGLSDHSRFCVIATVVLRATARGVLAFVDRDGGVRPGAGEVLPAILASSSPGVSASPGRPRCCSSGSAGERHGRAADQAAVTDDHGQESKDCARRCSRNSANVHARFPASRMRRPRWTPGARNTTPTGRTSHWRWLIPLPGSLLSTGGALGLRIPAELAQTFTASPPLMLIPCRMTGQAAFGLARDADQPWPGKAARRGTGPGGAAVGESVGGRTADMAGARAGPGAPSGCGLAWTRSACCWTVARVKTLPSRLDARDLGRLAASGPPTCPAAAAAPASGDVIEVERTVNASGNVGLGDHLIGAGLPLAGQQVALRP